MIEGASSAYPGFAIPSKPPRAGFLAGTRHNLKVTQRGPSCCWQLDFSRVFYQEPEDLGTRPRLHLSRRSQSPPKRRNLTRNAPHFNLETYLMLICYLLGSPSLVSSDLTQFLPPSFP